MHRPAWIIAGLLLLYAVLAWTSAGGKSLVYDEPLHLSAAVAQWQMGDYRVDPEDPAGFKWWVAVGLPAVPPAADPDLWPRIVPEPPLQWAWAALTVFGTAVDQLDALTARGRFMMLLVALGLGAAVAAWAWKIAGPRAGTIAAAVFALDPLMLGHGPIVKNDMMFALAYLGVAWSVWRVGQKVNIGRMATVAALGGVAVTVKFSGVLLAVLLPLMLAAWVVLPIAGAPSRLKRAGLSVAICVAAGLAGWLLIWASYGFRYGVSPDPAVRMDFAPFVHAPKVLQTIDRHRLLPHAYTYGLSYTLHSAAERKAFLLGEIRNTGWWYYFPLAMAVKTPLATIAMVLAAVTLAWRLPLGRHRWTAACLLVPMGLYLAVAMRSNLNIGIRHMIPLYPLAFVVIGVVLSRFRGLAIGLVAVLAVECLVAYPDYMAHFNPAAGGSKGGVHLLSDSNLDWGQDLPALSAWQAKHPGRALYLSYFGTSDPAAYGVRYTNAGAGYAFGLPGPPEPPPGSVFAVSATHLQGMYVPDKDRELYDRLRRTQPIAVLNGTIYLYEWK